MRLKRNLLFLGVALLVPCYLFVVLNTLLAPWPFLKRNRALIMLFALLALVVMAAFVRWAKRREALLAYHARAVRMCVVFFFFIVQLLLGSQMRFLPSADCGVCYYSAIDWVNKGCLDGYELQWLSLAPNIFPQFLLEVAIARVMQAISFLDSVPLYDGVVLVNAVLFAVGFWNMLLLICRLRGGVSQATFALNMALCLPMFYCTSELYSDALSMPFLMLGICLLTSMMMVKREGIAHVLALGCGCVLLLGGELRATVLIAFIAAGIVTLLTCRPRRMLCFITMGAVILAGHAALLHVRDDMLGEENLARWSMPVSHWLMMGVPDPYDYGNGSVNPDDVRFARDIEDPQERSAACWHEFHNRLYSLRYPDRMLSALSRKTLNTYDLQQTFHSESQAPQALKTVLIDTQTPQYFFYRHICTGIQIAQLLFLCVSVVESLRKQCVQTVDALCAVHLVGLFLFLALWESNPRYFFHAVPVMLLLSATGQQHLACPAKSNRHVLDE